MNYLKKNSMTVVDSSPFKEFILRCTGTPVDQGREFRLGIQKRRAMGAKIMFTYDPGTNKGNNKCNP